MKMTKATYLLTFAVAVALASTGCKNHRPVDVTKLPGSQYGNVGEPGAGGTVGSGDNGQIANASLDTFEGMVKDPAALAAYTVHFAYDSAAVKKSERSNIQAVADALS